MNAPPGQYRTTSPISVHYVVPAGTVVTVDNAGKGVTSFLRNGVPFTLTDFSVYEYMIGISYESIPRRSKTRRNMRKSKSSRRNRIH
jgi:hypothetical protein